MAHLSAWGRYESLDVTCVVHAQHHWHRHWTRPTGAYCTRSKIDTIHALYPNLWLVVSDTYAPNAGDIMYECPLTLWNSANIDISEAQRQAASTMTTIIAMISPLSLPFNIVASVNLVVMQLRIQNTDKGAEKVVQEM